MIPLHIGITMHGIKSWADLNQTTIQEAYQKGYKTLSTILKCQNNLNIPIFSIHMIPEELQQSPNFQICKQETINFLQTIKPHDTQTKITILGKWYDIQEFIDPIKKLLEETQDYDKNFLNLCINYNGQEEILDACKLIARRIKANKLEPDSITKETIKESIYTSAFPPPNIIIKNGLWKEVSGFLLWDSAEAYLHTTNKAFPDMTAEDITEAINSWMRQTFK